MTTVASKPDWAPAVWRDNRGSIYAQFGQDVLRFEATENGLGKLLKIIPLVEGQPGYISGGQNLADETIRKHTKVAKETERKRILKSKWRTLKRRSMLQDMIKKHGIKESK